MIKTKFTKEAKSEGIIEKEKHIAINLKKGNIDLKKENMKICIDEKNTEYTIIKESTDNVILDVKIPNNIKSTILSWDTYRNNEQNYFNIDFDEIGNRIANSNKLEIKYIHDGKEYIKGTLFDTVDSYKINLNFIFENELVNTDYRITKIEDWKI